MARITATCKHCGKRFRPQRAGAQYCCNAHRVAAHRKRQTPPPPIVWLGKRPALSTTIRRSRNANGSPALSNAELGERLIEIADRDDDGEPKTGRRYYYLALSHGYIRPDMGDTLEAKKTRDAAYSRVTAVLGKLRMAGELDWGMVLDLTCELEEWQMYGSPREARAHLRNSYDEDRWRGQPYFPVLLVEKDTMEPVCKPMAMQWQMPFASSRGYSSLTLQHDVAKLLIQRHAETGQHAIVYFISDLDPSGLDLQRAWEEALSNFGAVAIFVRIGLTFEQVQDPTLDLQHLAIDVKPSDKRSSAYVAQYGTRCWKADVLPAEVIRNAIDRHVNVWLDRPAWDQRNDEIERNRSLL